MPGIRMEWVLEIRHESLTPVFKALTGLGETGFFIAFLALGYWLIQPDLFRRATLVLLFTGLANGSLKELFQVPRPQLEPLVEAGGWSFPSGHAQTAGALWPWLALEARRVWLAPARIFLLPCALVLAGGVSFSRVYLGVHTPLDVVAGLALGGASVALLWRIQDRTSWWWTEWDTHARALAASALVLAWWGALPGSAVNAAPAGGLLGFWVASLYEQRHLCFLPPQSNLQRVIAGVLGLVLVFGLRVLLKMLLADTPLPEEWAYFLRYAVIGATIGLGVPYALFKVGWAGGERGAS